MEPSRHVTATIDLTRVRANAEAVRQQTGRPVIAVIKADAYGLGALPIVRTLADAVEAFYVFDADEAVIAETVATGKHCIALHGRWTNAADYRAAKIRPVVWDVDRAQLLRQAKPVLSVDTGQQRFAAADSQLLAVQRAGDCQEIMTHATRLEQADQLKSRVESLPVKAPFLHASGSALLGEPRAWLDAVRPGIALYRGAVTVSTPLVEARDSNRAAGYTGFVVPRLGVILMGYRHGLQIGVCRVNGTQRRVVEVGMQSAFVELGPGDQSGNIVTLLGRCEDGSILTERQVADAWDKSEQEVLVRYCGGAVREHIGG